MKIEAVDLDSRVKNDDVHLELRMMHDVHYNYISCYHLTYDHEVHVL